MLDFPQWLRYSAAIEFCDFQGKTTRSCLEFAPWYRLAMSGIQLTSATSQAKFNGRNSTSEYVRASSDKPPGEFPPVCRGRNIVYGSSETVKDNTRLVPQSCRPLTVHRVDRSSALYPRRAATRPFIVERTCHAGTRGAESLNADCHTVIAFPSCSETVRRMMSTECILHWNYSAS